MKVCGIEGCDRKLLARELCGMHYERRRRTGDTGEAEPRKVTGQSTCTAEGCAREAECRHLCSKHYKRWLVFGQEGIGRMGTRDAGHTVSYTAAHYRIRSMRGRASLQSCAQCTDRAAEWSYMHDDPNEVFDSRGIAYSQDPNHYQPMCISCHRNFDLNFIKLNQKLSQVAGASSISEEK